MSFTDKLKAGYKKATSKETKEKIKGELKKLGKTLGSARDDYLEKDKKYGGGLGLIR